MAIGIYPSLFFTVALLVTTAYFLMGGLPLLILQHDTALDARFVRRFFAVYYQAATVAAVGACLGYALWGRFGFALGAALLVGVVRALRRALIPAMQQLGERIEAADVQAIARFKRVHAAALGVNLAQLMVLVWGTLQLQL